MEICYTNVWGTVCDDDWDIADAQVACRQLGYPNTEAFPFSSMDTPIGTGVIWLDNLNCIGIESSLFECSSKLLGSITVITQKTLD